MIKFIELNKSEKSSFLPLLFDIFYNNTAELAPSEKSYIKVMRLFGLLL